MYVKRAAALNREKERDREWGGERGREGVREKEGERERERERDRERQRDREKERDFFLLFIKYSDSLIIKHTKQWIPLYQDIKRLIIIDMFQKLNNLHSINKRA